MSYKSKYLQKSWEVNLKPARSSFFLPLYLFLRRKLIATPPPPSPFRHLLPPHSLPSLNARPSTCARVATHASLCKSRRCSLMISQGKGQRSQIVVKRRKSCSCCCCRQTVCCAGGCSKAWTCLAHCVVFGEPTNTVNCTSIPAPLNRPPLVYARPSLR